MAEPLNTGLSAQQVLTAFDRALNDYTDAEIDALLSAKQDTIADISEIRSGAAAGAGAVQQTAFETDQQRQDSEIGTVAEQGKSSYDFIFGLGTALQSNDDLNNYNKAGKIYAATGAIARTISNAPWKESGFMAITIPFLTSLSYMQFVLPSTMTGKWYRRRYTQGAWSAWIEYDGTQVTTT